MHVDLDQQLDRAAVLRHLREQGLAALSAGSLQGLVGDAARGLDALRVHWDSLPSDAYLKDGGRYRRRRHGNYELDPLAGDAEALRAVAHRAHWQPTTYNALHGGMLRWFEPLPIELTAAPAWSALLVALGRLFAQASSAPVPRWFVEAHAFRIETTDGIGRPTPEGAHRDGVDFVAVILLARAAIRGGETRVFEAEGARGVRFTLDQPWSALLLDDARVVHESTPIVPVDEAAGVGHRDTLVLTFRAGGFQQPGPGEAVASLP